jgi:hypothetical protein
MPRALERLWLASPSSHQPGGSRGGFGILHKQEADAQCLQDFAKGHDAERSVRVFG